MVNNAKKQRAKRGERLVKRLLEGNDNLFDEFVVVGLEDSLEIVCNDVERLIVQKNLEDFEHTDLTELHYDGLAIIRTLKYYTGCSYTEEVQLMNKAWGKLLSGVF